MSKKELALTLPEAPAAVVTETSEEDIKSFKKKTVSGAVSFFIRTVILQLLGFAAQFFLASRLNPSDFGIYGIVIQLNALLTFFSDIGLGATLIQRQAHPTTEEYRTVFTVQQIVTWLVFLLTASFVILGLFTEKIGYEGNLLLLAFALSLPIGSLRTIPTLILERKLDFSKIAAAQLIEQVIYNIVLIGLVLMNWGVLAYAIAVLVRTIVGVIATYRFQSWSFGLAWHKKSFKSVIGMGMKFQTNDLLARIKDQLFYLVFAWALPLEQFGYIQWAKGWSQYPYNLTVQNVIQITFPVYSRLQHDPRLLAKAIEKSLFFISLGIFPILVGMCIFIQPFTDLYQNWGKWQPGIFSFILFTISIGFAAISTPLTNTLNAIGKINTTLKLMIMWTALTWTLTPLFIWPLGYGFDGVAITSFVISITSIIPVIIVKKIIPFSMWDQIWRQLLASMIMAIYGYYFISTWSSSWENFGIGIASAGLLYVVVMLLCGYDKTKTEVQSLINK